MTGNARFNVLSVAPGPNAFMHSAAAANIERHVTTIDHPSLNDRAGAKFLITQNYGTAGPYNDHPVGIYFAAGRWRIFNQDFAPMPAGARFNVYVDDRILSEVASSSVRQLVSIA